MIARGRHRPSTAGGSAIIEFAILAPALIIGLFGIIEVGRALWLQNALHYAVQAAARCASINTATCSNLSSIQSYAASVSGAQFDASVFSWSGAASCGNQVSGSYPMSLYIPFVGATVTLTAQACFPKSS
jgi:Flp pilus assembly protein TadG